MHVASEKNLLRRFHKIYNRISQNIRLLLKFQHLIAVIYEIKILMIPRDFVI